MALNNKPEKVPIMQCSVAGVMHHPEYGLVYRDLQPGINLVLEPDPTNPHDRYAVKVKYKGGQIGWVPRHNSEKVARLIAAQGHMYGKIISHDPGDLQYGASLCIGLHYVNGLGKKGEPVILEVHPCTNRKDAFNQMLTCTGGVQFGIRTSDSRTSVTIYDDRRQDLAFFRKDDVPDDLLGGILDGRFVVTMIEKGVAKVRLTPIEKVGAAKQERLAAGLVAQAAMLSDKLDPVPEPGPGPGFMDIAEEGGLPKRVALKDPETYKLLDKQRVMILSGSQLGETTKMCEILGIPADQFKPGYYKVEANADGTPKYVFVAPVGAKLKGFADGGLLPYQADWLDMERRIHRYEGPDCQGHSRLLRAPRQPWYELGPTGKFERPLYVPKIHHFSLSPTGRLSGHHLDSMLSFFDKPLGTTTARTSAVKPNPSNTPKESTMNATLNNLFDANKNAATTAATMEAGRIANNQVAKFAAKKLPFMVSAYADTPMGKLVIANIAQQTVAHFRPEDVNLGKLTAAMAVQAYMELLQELDIDGFLDELLDSPEIKRATKKLIDKEAK